MKEKVLSCFWTWSLVWKLEWELCSGQGIIFHSYVLKRIVLLMKIALFLLFFQMTVLVISSQWWHELYCPLGEQISGVQLHSQSEKIQKCFSWFLKRLSSQAINFYIHVGIGSFVHHIGSANSSVWSRKQNSLLSLFIPQLERKEEAIVSHLLQFLCILEKQWP